MLAKLQKAAFHINSHQKRQNMAERRGDGEKTSQDCWTLMTRAEKVLLFLLILALVALVALSAFIIAHFLNEENCDTHECIQASYQLLKIIDFDTNPCVDFHQFICGNYIPIQEERKVDLVTADPHDDDSPLLATVKNFYQACTNESAIEEDNESTLSTLISQIGGWPLLMGKEWKEETFNWQSFMVEVRPWGIKYDWLLSFDYYEDKNGTNLLQINPPNLKSSSFQFKLGYYQETLAKLAGKLGGFEFVQGQLTQMMVFESNLSRISETARKSLAHEGDYRRISVSRMNEIWPENLFSEILNGLARGYSVFANSTTIVVASENYLYELHKLLMAVPKRTQANYFVWKTIETFLPFSSNDIREVYAKYFDLGTREEHCHTEAIRRFHSIVEEEYVGKYKNEKTLPLLESIVNLTYQSYNKSEEAEAHVVIEGPEGKHSGVTNIKFNTQKIVRMVNQIQFHIDNEFFRCLHRKYDSCVKEGYYEDTEKLETYFDTSDKTIHLPYNLVYSESFMWDQPNYINFAKIGRTVGDKVIEAEEQRYNRTINKQGVNLAYQGYISWLQSNGMEKRLPVLNYTIRQLFWIHSSSSYCSEDDLDKFGEVARSQYFKEDFQCR